MRRTLPILFLLCALRCQAMPVTNEIDGTIDSSSYDTSPYAGLWCGYFASGIINLLPQFTNSIVSVSRSGADWQNQFQQQQAKYCPAIWCMARSNGVVPFDWMLASDNSDFQSNNIYQWGTNLFNAPSNIYNGTVIVDEGFDFPVAHIALGANVSFVSGGDGGAVSRNAGAMKLDTDYGVQPVDLWHDTSTNGLNSNLTDVSGNDWFYALGHLTQKNALATMIAVWRGLGLETNIGSITFDFTGASVSASNHFAAVNLSRSGTSFSCTIKADRMPPSWDIVPSVSNNVATTLWGDMPSYGSVFQWPIQFTNFTAPGTYNLYVDGVLIDSATDAQWATGRNLATNAVANNPWNAQRTKVLYDVRNKYGVDPLTGLPTHDAGTIPPQGPDLIIYQSNAGIWPGTHGPALVAALATDTASLRNNYDVPAHNDAQQTSHTLTLVLTVSNATVTNLNAGTLTIL